MGLLRLGGFFVLAFLLASCGPPKTDSNTDEEISDRNALRQLYEPFEGFYQGFVYPDTGGNRRPVPVEMRLWIGEVRSGVNDKGESTFRLELQGYFHPTDFDLGTIPRARRPISGRYYKEINQLALQNTELSPGPIPGQGAVSITAALEEGSTLTGNVNFTIVNPVSGRLVVRKR
jgi:hypothetical protein